MYVGFFWIFFCFLYSFYWQLTVEIHCEYYESANKNHFIVFFFLSNAWNFTCNFKKLNVNLTKKQHLKEIGAVDMINNFECIVEMFPRCPFYWNENRMKWNQYMNPKSVDLYVDFSLWVCFVGGRGTSIDALSLSVCVKCEIHLENYEFATTVPKDRITWMKWNMIMWQLVSEQCGSYSQPNVKLMFGKAILVAIKW